MQEELHDGITDGCAVALALLTKAADRAVEKVASSTIWRLRRVTDAETGRVGSGLGHRPRLPLLDRGSGCTGRLMRA